MKTKVLVMNNWWKIIISFFLAIMFLVFINGTYAKDGCECGIGPCDECVNPQPDGSCCCNAKSSSSGSSSSSKPAHSHSGGSATCTSKPVCSGCGKSYGSALGHSYTKTCGEAHCTASVCSRCGDHKGTCGGGHDDDTCSHCGASYCGKCSNPGHPCSHNSDGKCDDEHCDGETWCTICEDHECNDCSYTDDCDEPHCDGDVCSVCGDHEGRCDGGHDFDWETDDKGAVQSHIKECQIGNCTETKGSSHTSVWGKGDKNHKSVCTVSTCDLTYTHSPKWSTDFRTATELHPCVWGTSGCEGTHSAVWGPYYKVNGGVDGDEDGGPHTRECNYVTPGESSNHCNALEKYHTYTDEQWIWGDNTYCLKTCKVCGLKQKLPHLFTEYQQKDIEATSHSELYKHWKICTRCNPSVKRVDELHEDNGEGKCTKCLIPLWKIVTSSGEDITEETLKEENAKAAFRRAVQFEKIKIIEVVDNNGNPKTQYVTTINLKDSEETINVGSDGYIEITKNGTYQFTTGRGGTAEFVIDNISRAILIDKIIDPITSTTGNVTITIRNNKSEEQFNKEIYIEDNENPALNTGWCNPRLDKKTCSITKTVTHNGTYYFTARDTAGNTREIEVLIDNITKGQASVAISNDVFKNGYIFTEILVNPDENWVIDPTSAANNIISATSYKVGETSGTTLSDKNIKIVKVMDSQRVEVSKSGTKYSGLPGSYYIQVAIGGSIFNEKGTYIIDLESVNLANDTLTGKNRIIVEVQDLKDLT